MNGIENKVSWERIFLTGAELFTLYKGGFQKIKIKDDDVDKNAIQRYYEEWEEKRIKEYLKSLDDNFPHPPLYFLETNLKNEKFWYVVDGQHRILTIFKKINDKNNDYYNSKLKDKLFEIIIIKAKTKMGFDKEEFFKEGNNIFLKLNNTSTAVSNAEMYKSLFYSKSISLSKKLAEKYKNHFGKNNNKKFDDRIFLVFANSAFLIYKKEKIKNVVSMDKKIKEFLVSPDFDEDLIKTLIKIVDEFGKNELFLNKLPNPQTLYVVFSIIYNIKNGIEQINKIKDFIYDLDKHKIWKDSKKNTRSPHKLFYKYIIFSECNDYDHMIEIARKELN